MIAEALRSRRVSFVALAIALVSSRAQAQSIAAEPAQPIEAPFPQGAPPIEVQIVLQLIIDEKGNVESAVETSRAPVTAPDSFATAALGAVRAAKFTPSTRDGRPVRSRIEHVVVFHPRPIALLSLQVLPVLPPLLLRRHPPSRSRRTSRTRTTRRSLTYAGKGGRRPGVSETSA